MQRVPVNLQVSVPEEGYSPLFSARKQVNLWLFWKRDQVPPGGLLFIVDNGGSLKVQIPDRARVPGDYS
jgi:hypothetical protein